MSMRRVSREGRRRRSCREDLLLVELRKIRQRGYARLRTRSTISACVLLSAPIADFTGAVRAAISSLNGSPGASAIWREPRTLVALVIAAAKEISENARFPWGM